MKQLSRLAALTLSLVLLPPAQPLRRSRKQIKKKKM